MWLSYFRNKLFRAGKILKADIEKRNVLLGRYSHKEDNQSNRLFALVIHKQAEK